MTGFSARRRRWSAALALVLFICCAVVQTGCLRPPTTASETLAPLYNLQPAPAAGAGPGPVLPGVDATASAPPVINPGEPITTTPAPAPAPFATQPPVLAPAPTAQPLVAVPAPAVAAPAPAVNAPVENLSLTPNVIVAQVGSNVVMVANLTGPANAPLMGRRVEWTLASTGVGQVTDVGRAPAGFFGIGTTPAQKVNQLFAINETFSRNVVVTHGVPGTGLGDLVVGRGQTWITVSSPTEGDSYVTAVAPELANWMTRQQTAVIHWVDAQWLAAPPGVEPAGSRHVFTTTITRRSTGGPVAGWIVRYEITGGPSAGFAPDGARAIEVATNDLGQANAEILQPQAEPGSSPVLIQLIRPAVPGGQRLVVGTAATEQTWTGAPSIAPPSAAPPNTAPPPTAPPSTAPSVPPTTTAPTTPTPAAPRTSLKMSGPSEATVGATASYRIDVTNSGDQPATGVVVSDPLPDGLSFLKSAPAADAGAAGATVQWTLGTLQPGESRTIQLDTRVEKDGAINHCASLRTAEGIAGQDCVATTVRAATIELRLSGPDKGIVGESVRFEVDIVNRGDTQATGLVLKDTFDEGFVHAISKSPIERPLDPLAPNRGQKIGITFKIAKAGRLCHTVELIGPNGMHKTSQACLEATEAGPPPKPAVTLKISGPATAAVGEMVLFTIEAKNGGDAKATNLKIINAYDGRLLDPKFADQGYSKNDSELSWTIASIEPGQSVRRQVKFACTAAGRVCDKATATDGGESIVADEACLEISPAEAPPVPGGKLSLTAAPKNNPIKVGGDTTFVITVNNAGPNPERKVALVVKVPDALQYVEGAAQNPTKPSVVDGPTIRFEPIAQLAAGEKLSFEIKLHANRAGDAAVHAEATSQSTLQPVSTDGTVNVFAE